MARTSAISFFFFGDGFFQLQHLAPYRSTVTILAVPRGQRLLPQPPADDLNGVRPRTVVVGHLLAVHGGGGGVVQVDAVVARPAARPLVGLDSEASLREVEARARGVVVQAVPPHRLRRLRPVAVEAVLAAG